MRHSLTPRTPLISSTMSSSLAVASSFNFSSLRNAHPNSLHVSPRRLYRSRLSMTALSSSPAVTSADYKPTNAFLFPGQGAQALGMGKEAQSVPAAAELYTKASDILGNIIFNEQVFYKDKLKEIPKNSASDNDRSTVVDLREFPAYESQRITPEEEEQAAQEDHQHDSDEEVEEIVDPRSSQQTPVTEVCVNGPKEKLDSTVISQPALYVTSLAAVELLRARDGGQEIIDSVDVTCGLSLGEYTALAFAGSFSFEDGLKLVKLRGEAMQEAADAAKGAMVSVIGLDSDKVQLLCDAANEEVDDKDKVQIANFLCTGNYAVSGGVKGVEALEAKAKSFKARMTVRLAVAGAFHTRFMDPAVSRLEAKLAETQIRTPRIPVISNVDAQPHSDPEVIKKILARQVTSPVQWETTVKTLLSKGLKKSYELGPGKVIAGIVKRMDRSAEIENIGA